MTDVEQSENSDFPMTLQVAVELAGQRLDVMLARSLPQYSRSRLQDWVRAGRVLVEGEVVRPRDAVREGEQIEVWPEAAASLEDVPQNIPLQVVHADADLIVINKEAGRVMHPAPGHPDNTLLNAVLFHFPDTVQIPRAGIVHRLDRDTTGLVVVARTESACLSLTRQLQERTMRREYQALVHGELISGQTIDAPIGRHPRARQKLCVRAGGRDAITHVRIRNRYEGATLLGVRLETGRTHQIRVHLSHLGYPVVGDPVYGAGRRMPAGLNAAARDRIASFARQALHAATLELKHPTHGEQCTWEASLPEDFRALLEVLDEKQGP